MTEEHVLRWARDYAPLVRFDRGEVHFPSDPLRFAVVSRFRESRESERDLGWNRVERRWVRSNDRGSEYFGEQWKTISDESLRRLPGEGPLLPWRAPNVRPWDRGNLRSPPDRGTAWGLFLERDDRLDRRTSGTPPVGNRVTAPLFVDVSYDAPSRSFRVLYWFFYELNRWKWFLTHEGDWEHISFLVSEEALQEMEPPSSVYFAQHNTGDVRPYLSLMPSEDGHRTVFVDKDGHPTNPTVSRPSDYPIEWRTWEGPMRLVVREEWRDFAGAWGEVGNKTDFTGPLGPLFKRNRDLVRVTKRGGRLFVKTFKK
jgi:hypothetical protein